MMMVPERADGVSSGRSPRCHTFAYDQITVRAKGVLMGFWFIVARWGVKMDDGRRLVSPLCSLSRSLCGFLALSQQ